MIEVLAATSSLAALCAEFLKTRRDDQNADAVAAFRDWLRDEAFPRLIEQSDQTLRSVVALKAAETERFDALAEHLIAIRQLLLPPTAERLWVALSPSEQTLLRVLFRAYRDESSNIPSSRTLPDLTGLPAQQLLAAVRYSHEQGWVKHREYSGGWAASMTRDGALFVWEATDSSDFHAARKQLAIHLRAVTNAERVGTLARQSNVPCELVSALVSLWADNGWLSYADDCWPQDVALVSGISETFRRTSF